MNNNEITSLCRVRLPFPAESPLYGVFIHYTWNYNTQKKDAGGELKNSFLLAKELRNLCNAVYSEDSRATLFHGPAGTGKIMSCKLICQAIGLPIMDTVNYTENLDEFILSKYIPQGKKLFLLKVMWLKRYAMGELLLMKDLRPERPRGVQRATPLFYLGRGGRIIYATTTPTP